MLVLENLTHKFRRPNVLDVKLGQVLYDEASASPEKIERMKRAAEKTTSGELGLRLTGFQVSLSSRKLCLLVPLSLLTIIAVDLVAKTWCDRD